MAASVSQWNEFNAMLNGIYENPELVDYQELYNQILEMRASGTPLGKLVVKLRPNWPMGIRFKAAYEAAQLSFALPPVEWQGPKNSLLNPDYMDVQTELEKLNANTATATKGNPFAQLASLRR